MTVLVASGADPAMLSKKDLMLLAILEPAS